MVWPQLTPSYQLKHFPKQPRFPGGKYSAWEESPWALKTCDLGYRVCEGVILEMVAM